ncbi:MAG: class I SAM-dependent methyltransferase [Proteobacteria bacterium]|nr:class I SAM-dependent methyltransferase [Pseudomonadota bacterium]
MSQDRWSEVDRYISDVVVPSDLALDATLEASTAAGLPAINVAPNQGKLLALLVQMCSARTVLEIGTLGGYSAIWMAGVLPADGRLVTLEADPTYAEVARDNVARAGLGDVVDVRVGPALATLPQLVAEGAGPFDVVFIDADKAANADYFSWALRLTRRGSVIVVDNVVRGGAVVDAASPDPGVQGTRRLYELLGREPRVRATVIQTVGSKGYDGFALAEKDLELRGPGELLGTRQTGIVGFRVADLARDADLLPQVQELGDRLLQQSPDIAERIVSRWVGAALRYASA